MTTVPLQLNSATTPPFAYPFTLDGASYIGSVIWNLAAQRWYFLLTDQVGNQTWLGPLIGSPLNYDIPLAPGIFMTSTILFREDAGNFEVSP
jgi:hypothetical protein